MRMEAIRYGTGEENTEEEGEDANDGRTTIKIIEKLI